MTTIVHPTHMSPKEIQVTPNTLMPIPVALSFHNGCVCAKCGIQLVINKRYHVYNHDFCTIKHLIEWRSENPTKEPEITVTRKVQAFTEGWGNTF